ncbi:hypothetical protein DFH09DRAFT_1071199 [Mycena vulgaris]|nr:hypothetical protein DFH09DRAFT_1071199 [Mycena vulgaris]
MHYLPRSRPHSPPIASLPVELLAYVFVLGTHGAPAPAPADDSGCPPFDADSVKAPLIYGSVCRHWRAVALSTPALYTSLCITPELLRPAPNGSADAEVLDTRGIAAYLARSRACPLDILIDARDPDWDFDDPATYTPWFTPAHMHTALSLLLPSLARWRTLSILTDLPAPLHAALRPLAAALTLSAHGAPELTALRLMRCDAYAARGPAPDPAHVFLSASAPHSAGVLFPSLRHLTLLGVPTAWPALASALLPTSALRTLELAYLPAAAQPSPAQLAALLARAPGLVALTLNGAGPSSPSSLLSPSAFASPAAVDDAEPNPLPHLTALTLGYTSPRAGLAVLGLLCAPHLERLVLEDAGAEDADADADGDARPVLARLFPADEDAPAGPFPALAHLTLRRVHLAAAPSSPPVRLAVARLELVGMPLSARSAVQLRVGELCVRGAPDAGAALRGALSACPAARVIEVHESALTHPHPGAESEEEFCVGATRVRVFRALLDADADTDEDEDTLMGSDEEGCAVKAFAKMDVREGDVKMRVKERDLWEAEEDAAFRAGGVFNDPVFDARWGAYAAGGVVG